MIRSVAGAADQLPTAVDELLVASLIKSGNDLRMSPLQETKLFLITHLHLGKDALHIYVALGLLLGSALVMGWRLQDWKPWLLVLAAALAGEALDLRDSLIYGTAIDLKANGKDLWNTLFWPSVILLLARKTALFGPSGR